MQLALLPLQFGVPERTLLGSSPRIAPSWRSLGEEKQRKVNAPMMKPTQTTLRNLVILLALLLTASFSVAREKKLAPELNDKMDSVVAGSQNQNPAEMVDVIIQFRKDKPLSGHIQKMLGLGVKTRNSFDVVHGGLFRIPVSMVAVLSQDPDVLYISPDRPVKHTSWWDYMLDASQAGAVIQAGYNGEGIGIAIIDSGIKANHPDLQDDRTGASRVVYSQSFVAGDTSVGDAYGHGTHVAGLVAGNGQVSGGGMFGVAQDANLINLRVLDANGAGTDSAVIAAIQRAIQLKNTYNIHVINLSLGRRVFESYTLDPVCQAVEQAWKAGIVVVVAAGNYGRDNSQNTNGYGTITVPGNDPYVITVGATNTHATDITSDDTVTSYSSKGPALLDHVIKPDLVAPGNRIVSLLANGSTLDKLSPGDELSPSAYGSSARQASYFVLSGTSMAAPVVSGTVALMLQRIPNLTPDQIKIRLMKTASKSYSAYAGATASNGSYYSLQNDIFTVGTGYVNVYGAVASNEMPNGNSLSPIAALDVSGKVRVQADPSSAWANSNIWGTSIVWGDNVLQGNSIIWGDSIVWGDSQNVGFSIIWGNSIVWGDNVNTFSESGDSDNN
ncbi:MAG TPA: S8 family peptidase [Candidatus Angelobacter sp.]|nr:S8 family peptidase [Candidatus Angelobacter sp.]